MRRRGTELWRRARANLRTVRRVRPEEARTWPSVGAGRSRKHHRTFLWGVLVCAWCALLLGDAATSPATDRRQPDFDAVDAYVEGEMEKDRVPGLALAIVRDERVVHLRGFGEAAPDAGAVTPRTAFMLGSGSKSFTALAVMQLVEEGEVDLDAPVSRYLPWFRVADPKASRRITVRHLLNQTGGLPENALRARGVSATLEEHVRALGDVELDHPPGEKYAYSSPNYQVLGLIVEEVSGQPFGEYVVQNIYGPLGMEDSFVSRDEARRAGVMASGHRYWFGWPVADDLPYEEGRLPTASLISSSRDLASYMIAQLEGGRYGEGSVLSPEGVAGMHRPAAPSGEGYSYAMGWRVGPIDGVEAIHHGGTLPDFRGKMVLLPEQGWGVAVLTNASSFVGAPTSHRVADGVAGMLVGQEPDEASLGLGRLYLLIDAALLLVTLGQARGILSLRRWHAEMARRASVGGASAQREIRPVALEIAWPLVLLIGLPQLIGIPWSDLVLSFPDVGYWAIAVSGVGLCVGLIKAALVFAAFRRGRPGGTE